MLRTSWVYGARGRNFLLTIRRLAQERDELRIVADQTGVPNWCRTLAEATAARSARGLPWLADAPGLYHLVSGGATTWYGFAQAIVGDVPRPRVVPIATSDYPTAGAPSGLWCTVGAQVRGHVRLPDAGLARWLAACLSAITRFPDLFAERCACPTLHRHGRPNAERHSA